MPESRTGHRCWERRRPAGKRGPARCRRSQAIEQEQIYMYLEKRPEGDTDRRPGLGHVPGGAQPARLAVDAEGDDGIAVLIRGQQEGARGIEIEIARRLTLRRLMPHRAEVSRGRIAGKDGDAVVSP